MTRRNVLKELIFEIENTDPGELKIPTIVKAFELKTNHALLSNLSGNYGALFIRAILNELNVDEHRIFKWRLENKFEQYQILNYYSPGSMPHTLSFSDLLHQQDGIQKINELFRQGYFLKATLGDASFVNGNWDKTHEFNEILRTNTLLPNRYESYMLQRKMKITCEFRVHTFCREVIPFLNYIVHGQKTVAGYSDVTSFLNKILHILPDSLLQGVLIGWDVALTNENKYQIIEANFTGFHPEYRAGFQTTGYVDSNYYGSIICAWLNIYFRRFFGVYIDSVEESLFINHSFYRSFVYYMSLFKNVNFEFFINSRIEAPSSIVIYLGEDTNRFVYDLIKHFLLVDFAKMYYVIIRDECFLKANKLFDKNNRVQIWAESWLVTKDQFELIKQLGYDRRKQICSYHALRRFKDKSCVII